jgi:hypothetical protein
VAKYAETGKKGGGDTDEGRRAGAKTRERKKSVSSLLGGNQHVFLRVEKRGQELDGALLQDLNVQRHPLGVALQRPDLQSGGPCGV